MTNLGKERVREHYKDCKLQIDKLLKIENLNHLDRTKCEEVC